MESGKRLKTLVMVAIAMTLTPGAVAQAGQFKVLHEFRGKFDGVAPVAGLIEDANGNLYGTTIGGGLNNDNTCNAGCGTVFELSPNGGGGWTKTTLHRFTGNADGGEPVFSLVMDGAGNLYGTNENGGSLLCGIPGCGTVFELSPDGSGGWTESTIYSFAPGSGGFSPTGSVQDASGNLYGVTGSGGANYGVVFELSLSGGVWTETVLHTFDKSDGFGPNSTLLLDGSGNLFGTTIFGGVLTGACKAVEGCGTEFELSPAAGGGWNFNEYVFSSPGKGLEPNGTAVEDSARNLFGVTSGGGDTRNGNVFKLTPVAGGGWTESVIHVFNGANGSGPVGLVPDGHGGYYGATAQGGSANCNSGCGLVFDLTPGPGGGWVETVLHRFSGLYDGSLPNALFVDGNGNIFGTTEGGGSTACPGGCGTAFEITAPSKR